MGSFIIQVIITLQNHIAKESSVKIANKILSLLHFISLTIPCPSSEIFITFGQPIGKYIFYNYFTNSCYMTKQLHFKN